MSGRAQLKNCGPLELQVRTLAQHLWSEMSHDAVYKSEHVTLPEEFKRRIDLMAGLIEVADMEFERLNTEYPQVPAVQILRVLERWYYRFSSRRPDPELSLNVIQLLLPLYSAEPPVIIARLEEFVAQREAELHALYDEQTALHSGSAFLFQPEALMIYDRLEADQVSTRTAWNTKYPEEELEALTNTFGISFD